MDIKDYVINIAKNSKLAAKKLSYADTNTKNKALIEMSKALLENKDYILSQNKIDIENAEKIGTSKALIDRLTLNDKRITDMAEALIKTSSLQDPIGEVIKMWKTPDELQIGQMRVPLGVIGIIYEARPNVTVDAAALCIKSGNSVILRGGKEAINSNTAIAKIIKNAVVTAGLPDGSIEFIDITDRETVNVMMRLNGLIDVLIPRGGAGLIKSVVENSSVPVIETGTGNCHVYVDKYADFDKAERIIINAKLQRPAVCNAMESLLVHKDVAHEFLPRISSKLKELKVQIRGCAATQKIVKDIVPATDEDFGKEFLDLILSVKVVDSLEEAIDHIFKYSTKHSEAIITENYTNAQRFLKEVDAAAVYVNASTRFTDGEQFGFGGEIGISTQKLHARGPMGLEQLTTTKYVIYGDGQIRK
ncbi:glutamate-5-semialdehyde dehydrogenase [Clostridium acetobutylicum]|uniref:Gamma-glutamyl phosphate reductase n=1 Tax=Clostridium acetobutylicum (strain ATCC 824 / DSM 792 / JCM 1419 / IAM 19013 / LMG 5710 / NBRC 13948 / NRRL B-527 / VKM B-1787 / 2291 / W) TaxID=272562 RepID=PROA_CLOAB|nr:MULTISPECIES: glutamate-5-semialdehyde dehydrogenase [Clostridium]Q97E62.1 RecName: Full=Gamma-glutamyl phosphate reductase; Short=GPR; AltName: Full=Glutamate-5-semialdehyde dehydrogenase; AltName: Full=Glutamyl-gamma-semialdehyde dehydrogenase; Short=GSA dehydrogenase [Clostridium acetobutylicum ATCC 824]AAK81188.1 Gamma-glutamyl phosphate reductase [Clostridium acetobutylicum ATCC 824]ADZ22294.1 gamma-glutamyl phosphate reductase [Clostridium acetobutylicum EA 2018]AEI33034.1 gamma-glutam